MAEANEKKDDTVYLSSEVNEIFATTEVTQYFTNPLDKSIELKIIFPINENITLSKFEVSIDDKKIKSKVMAKEKAEEKYSDSVASGNMGFISRYEEDNKAYSVNIGNLKPKQQIELKSYFIEMIGSKDLSYEFNIMEDYPDFQYDESSEKKKTPEDNKNKKIDAHFKIETQSKITRLISPFLSKINKNDYIFKINYGKDYKSAEVEYINKKPKLDLIIKEENEKKENLNILFRTENMNNPILYSQYNPELKETAYSINYTYISKYLKEIPIPDQPDEICSISYVAKYENNVVNDTPCIFIFLIDQSGSMGGKSIELAKNSLLLFIQSLPENSYFQLIGFGTTFKKYNERPVKYNQENISNIINIINGLSANLGGTNISSPLKEIYNSNSDFYSKINLSKNIFLLTDGQVFDSEECYKVISQNSKKFRIHALGIGNDFDKVLIERCGSLGRGTSSFVENVNNLNSVVIDALNKCMRPYITDIKFEFENYKEEISSNIISCKPTDDYTYQNEIMNYSFILPGDKELSNLKMKITGKDPINIIEKSHCFSSILKIKNGEEMSKMIVGKALKNNEELIKDEKKEIEFAKKYQILSRNTALFAEISNEEKQQSELIKVNLVNISKKETRDINNIHNNFNMPMMGPPMLQGLQNPNVMIMGPNQLFHPMDRMGMNYYMGPMNQNLGITPIGGHSYPPPMTGLGMIPPMWNMMGPPPMMNMGMNPPMGNMMGPPPMMNMGMNPPMMAGAMNPMAMNSAPMNMAMNPAPMSMAMGSPPPSPSTINNNNSPNEKDSMNANKNLNLIMNQDIIVGSWEENDETKKLIDIVSLDKFNKIKSKIIALNKGENENKIIYTILVIYYLRTKCTENLNEYKLVINKAMKFLGKNGIDYDDIVSDI